jgi:hypothetical protein
MAGLTCNREGGISTLERLKIEAHAPIGSGDAEGLASAMEECV